MVHAPKILMIEAGGWGGIGHYTYNLCQALPHAGTEVTLLSGAPYELEEFPRDFTLRAAIDSNWSYGQKLKTLIQVYRETKPDLVHIQSTFSVRKDWLMLLCLRLLKCPIVYTAHNILPHDEAERSAPGIKSSFGWVYRLSNRIIVHAEKSHEQLQEWFGTPQKKIAIIPHGDYAFINSGRTIEPAEAKTWLGSSPDHKVILFFGAIRDYKGLPDLIDAFAIVAKTQPDVDLAIIGKPIDTDAEIYAKQIQSLGLQDRVIFRPEYVPIGDIDRYFAAADIAAYPYHSIYQSGALQLAYASSKPVVVTNVGALPETVKDGQNGLIVPAKDPNAFAEALIDLLGRPNEARLAMGKVSKQLADQNYSWDDIAVRTLDLYRELLPRF